MATFKDANGKDWIIALDGPKIREVRRDCKLDLAALDGSAYDRLADDPVLLVDTLWVLCRGQALPKNISDVQFGESLVGDAIVRATEAMLEAIVDFFPTSKRQLIRTLAEKTKKTRELGMAKALAKLTDPEIQTKIETAMENQMEAELQKLLTRWSSATDSPASSESAPTG